MKKLSILFLAVTALFFVSCKKEDKCPYMDVNVSAPSVERTQLGDLITANSVTATVHSSGAYYNIVTPGSGDSANVCSGITVKYRGTLFPSGTQFDASAAGQSVSFTLGGLIAGWQKLLPLIKEGGKIEMYIPPALGYGYSNQTDQAGNVVIPASSYLKFEVELLSVQ